MAVLNLDGHGFQHRGKVLTLRPPLCPPRKRKSCLRMSVIKERGHRMLPCALPESQCTTLYGFISARLVLLFYITVIHTNMTRTHLLTMQAYH